MVGNLIAGAELSEYRSVELFAIFANQHSRDAEPTEDVLHHKILYLFLNYGGQRFILYPLGEVVDGDDGEFDLTLSRRERSN